MAIVPDTKDWSWVLDRPCPGCGFDTQRLPTGELAAAFVDNAAGWGAVLACAEVSRRPSPDRWSAVEYGCHVRDVCGLLLERIDRILTEPDPILANWDQDAVALEAEYEQQEPRSVADQHAAAAAELAGQLDGLSGSAWQRPGRRSDGVPFTVERFSRYFLHDVVHHLWEVQGSSG